jgi:hypothetical protein
LKVYSLLKASNNAFKCILIGYPKLGYLYKNPIYVKDFLTNKRFYDIIFLTKFSWGYVMARFMINNQELKEILNNYEGLREESDFIDVYLVIGSDSAVISIVLDEDGVIPWSISLEAIDKENAVEDEGYYLEDWVVLELASILKNANNNVKVIIDTKNKKISVEGLGKTVEYNLL